MNVSSFSLFLFLDMNIQNSILNIMIYSILDSYQPTAPPTYEPFKMSIPYKVIYNMWIVY